MPLLRSATAVIDDSHFSADGHWVAYVSTESGQAEYMLASFPEFKDINESRQSPQRASMAARRKGLVYKTGDDQLMAVGQHHQFDAGDNSTQELFATAPALKTRCGQRMPCLRTATAFSCSVPYRTSDQRGSR